MYNADDLEKKARETFLAIDSLHTSHIRQIIIALVSKDISRASVIGAAINVALMDKLSDASSRASEYALVLSMTTEDKTEHNWLRARKLRAIINSGIICGAPIEARLIDEFTTLIKDTKVSDYLSQFPIYETEV